MEFFPDSIQPNGINFNGTKLQAKGDTIVLDNPKQRVEVLQFAVESDTLSVPVFKSLKAPVSISIPDQGYEDVALAGSFNGWNPSANPLKLTDGEWSTSLILNPGEHQYQAVIDGEWMLDPSNPQSNSHGMGGMNNFIEVGITNAKSPFISAEFHRDSIKIKADQNAHILVFWQNKLILQDYGQKAQWSAAIPQSSKAIDR
ncbi:MAG: hypothetical protein HRT74_07495, partial [Flavobacteriales bacterium]|nr:hypothetical protein [Flavobacteriales bacterium]